MIYNVVSISAVQQVTQSYIYIYIYTIFISHCPPSCSIPRDSIEFPVLYSRTSLLIHSNWKNTSNFWWIHSGKGSGSVWTFWFWRSSRRKQRAKMAMDIGGTGFEQCRNIPQPCPSVWPRWGSSSLYGSLLFCKMRILLVSNSEWRCEN